MDVSIEEAIDHNWKDYARGKIKQSDLVIFIWGKYTDTARGVSAEMSITHEGGKEYFLLCGRSDKRVMKPSGSHSSDKIYRWTWDNLKLLISGSRLILKPINPKLDCDINCRLMWDSRSSFFQ